MIKEREASPGSETSSALLRITILRPQLYLAIKHATLPSTRFQPDVFDLNLELVKEIDKVAKTKGNTISQVPIAWVVAQSKPPGRPVAIPIPGATTVSRVEENLTPVTLSQQDPDKISRILDNITVHGDRYGGSAQKFMDL